MGPLGPREAVGSGGGGGCGLCLSTSIEGGLLQRQEQPCTPLNAAILTHKRLT